LAYEFCRRYYASHGIVPQVIEHEGLGYYGIQLDYVPCKVNGSERPTMGRFTIGGDVENWVTGGPGDHGLELIKLCDKGEKTEKLVSLAIKHMGITPLPSASHIKCRHKRWGASYELMFSIATILAMRNEQQIKIWNHEFHTARLIAENDPLAKMKEHMGAFLFCNDDKQVAISGDGRYLVPKSGDSLWLRYMKGATPYSLGREIEKYLKLC